uniref:Sushi domain-containing protein n=1 Tax=Tetradesmus obliquus TaxID=3088 RepID=A0A383VF24_TETOB
MENKWLCVVICVVIFSHRAGAAHAAAAESGPAGPSAASGHMHVHAAQPAAPAGAPLGAVSAAHVHVASSAGPKPSAAPKTSEGPVSAAGPAGPAGPAGAELTGDMARSLLGTTGCANNDLPTPPTNAQWVASGNCGPADQESYSNTECQAACLPGFTASGSFSATCSFYEGNYVWAATATSLACKRPGCTGVPGSSPLPDNAAWSCGSSNAAVGSTCTAQCAPGYRQAGSWESTCTQQGWQAPTGTGVTCSLIVPDGPCSNSPGPSTDGMPANTQWACGQATLSGTTCQAACAPGYVNVARTTRTAACLDGLWEQPTGDMTCILGTDPCRQPPPLLWLPAGGEWDCQAPVSHAAACTASCEPGYNRTGAITAWCFNGNWVQPTTSITCTPAGCASNPKPQLDPDAVWTCQLPTAHGAACTAGCNGTNAPDPTTAICDFGTWVYSRGSCAGTASKIYYFNVQGLGHNMISLIEDIHSGAALTMANNVLVQRQKDFALYNPALSVLNISVQDAWISQSTSNTQRRRAASQRLLEHGGMDEVVVGVQVRHSSSSSSSGSSSSSSNGSSSSSSSSRQLAVHNGGMDEVVVGVHVRVGVGFAALV